MKTVIRQLELELVQTCYGDTRNGQPLWHLGDNFSLFIGPLNQNKLHSHSVAVFLAGVYGPFHMRIDKCEWQMSRTAVIPAGIAYEFDLGGQPLAVLYLEPDLASAYDLLKLVEARTVENGATLGLAGEVAPLRNIYEDVSSGPWIGSAIQDLIKFSKKSSQKTIDPRIAIAATDLNIRSDECRSVLDYASSAGLSTSRFQHLFTREVGVPFRRYRSWHRLRAAIRNIVSGSNFTAAAHAAGFFDQAHFARDFRRTFGAPASPTLKNIRR